MEASWIASSKECQVSDLCREGNGFHFLGFSRSDTGGLSDKGPIYYWQYYANFLRQLREKIKKKLAWEAVISGAFPSGQYASAHKSAVALATIHDCSFQLVEHPPYTPGLAPLDYYLFPKMKKELSGQYFTTDNDVIDAVEAYLEDQDSSFYERGSVNSMTVGKSVKLAKGLC